MLLPMAMEIPELRNILFSGLFSMKNDSFFSPGPEAKSLFTVWSSSKKLSEFMADFPVPLQIHVGAEIVFANRVLKSVSVYSTDGNNN